MPYMNGLELTKKIRELLKCRINEKEVTCLIFGVTGDQGEELIAECKEAGMNEVLFKPCTSKEIIQVLRNNGMIG